MTGDESAGRALARAYSAEVVEPLLASRFPGVPYASARVGTGSDVLGLDDTTSRDHDWGLRLSLFVPADRVDDVATELETSLPTTFRGHPARFAFSGDDAPRLAVDVTTVDAFLAVRLGLDPRGGLTPQGWLSLTGQAVLEVVAGPVFTDQVGDLTAARSALAWYPDALWRHVLAADWHRIDQELPLLGRTADLGDDLGSRIIAARLAHTAMHLAFLVARRWPPYAKWLGTAFVDIPGAPEVRGALDRALTASDSHERQTALADALDLLAARQRDLGLTDVETATVPFWDRPHRQVHPDLIPQLRAPIRDPEVRALPLGLGSAEQRTDVVDLLVDPAARLRLVAD